LNSEVTVGVSRIDAVYEAALVSEKSCHVSIEQSSMLQNAELADKKLMCM